MKKITVFILSMLITVSIMSSTYANVQECIDFKDNVALSDQGNYYKVTIEVNSKKSHWKIGEEYASKILESVPNYEELIDSYLAECSGSDTVYQVYIKRVEDMKLQIDKDYRDEIEGMASQLTGKTENIRGDGKISIQEMYLYNLFPDIARSTQCSALAVYGDRSETKRTMAERVLDWYAGSHNQLAKLQAITIFINGKKSMCTIGYLGYVGVLSGFNNNRIFAAILDSKTGGVYSSESKRSYPLDLRYALENCDMMDSVAQFMKNPKRQYSVGHLIFLCDSNTASVLENNMTSGSNCIREVRKENSILNDGVEWGIDNSIATVNSFILKGNFDNHTTQNININRWNSFKNQLALKGDTVTLDELKQIATYYNGSTVGTQADGSIYNVRTQQIIIYEPSNNNIEVFFRPKEGVLPLVPIFEKIDVKF